jgi:hypothetical protein
VRVEDGVLLDGESIIRPFDVNDRRDHSALVPSMIRHLGKSEFTELCWSSLYLFCCVGWCGRPSSNAVQKRQCETIFL